jgi:hypothetical protein
MKASMIPKHPAYPVMKIPPNLLALAADICFKG